MNDPNFLKELPVDAIHVLTTKEICRYLETSFDPTYYADRYPDMALGNVDPLEHFAIYGWKEGRDPCKSFSTNRYLAAHGDVAQEGVRTCGSKA